MNPVRLESNIVVYPQQITSSINYRHFLEFDETLDFVINIDQPKLDIYLSRQEDFSIATITEQFYKNLTSTTADSFITSSDIQIGSIKINTNTNISFDTTTHTNVANLLESAIVDTITYQNNNKLYSDYNIHAIFIILLTI